MRPANLPTGTVTFLFSDVEGSTKLLHGLGEEGYAQALAEHRRLLREAFARHGGVEVDTEGDAFFVAFPTARGALRAAAEAQAALAAGPIRLRIGIHTGTPLQTEEGYVGVDVHRAARIAAAGHGGQVVVSASAAALVAGEGLDLVDLGEHRLKDLAALERIYQLGRGVFPPLRSLSPSNLPVPASSFVGREAELAQVAPLLQDPTVRMLTLTGPGGVGKTRLALQAAAEASASFPDGVWWVPLAALRDSWIVAEAIGQVLSLRPDGDGVPLPQRIAAHLASRRTLLLLDNAEHLLPELAVELAGLLPPTPGSTILVTSRERLQLGAERVISVPPMSAGDAEALVQMRAAAIGVPLRRTEALDALCERLDRLPLALQLAAARLPVFSVEQLLERLSRRLDLLKGERDVDPRQRTMRATIEWSHDLLSPEEQGLFRRLAVFEGGCTLEAAEEVSDAEPDTLQALVDKSLLQRRDDVTPPRFWMLESIKDFAAERLEAAGDGATHRARHASWCRTLAERVDGALRSGDPEERWVPVLEADIDNLRGAVSFGLESGDNALVRAITVALPTYWIIRGRLREARSWLERARHLEAPADQTQRRLLSALGHIAYVQGDYAAATAASSEAAKLAARLGGTLERYDMLRAQTRTAMHAGNLTTAEAFMEEAFRLATEADNGVGMSSCRLYLADIANLTGRHSRAETLLWENLPFVRQRGQARCEGFTLQGLSQTSLYLRRPQEAADHAAAAARRASQIGDELLLVYCLEAFAAAVAHLGQAGRAARILGACDAAREKMEAPLDEQEQAAREQVVTVLKQALNQTVLDAAWEEGRGLDLQAALALANPPAT